jgi:hypothetical protein
MLLEVALSSKNHRFEVFLDAAVLPMMQEFYAGVEGNSMRSLGSMTI